MARSKEKNEEITGNLDPKHWVQKSDPLLLMRSVPFSLGELKILDTYISRINAADDTRRTVIFTKAEYEHLMGLTCADYRNLRKSTKNMLTKIVELLMPNNEYKQFLLFEEAEYCKNEYGEPIIKLTCTSRAKEIFFCIGKYHYFKYALENIIKLNRKSSYLLYVYIIANRFRGDWTVDLDELRDTVLDCKGQVSYQEYKIFKNRVLDPAIKEINSKTDCHFEYEAVKRGRRVAKIKFIYQNQDQIKGQLALVHQSEPAPLSLGTALETIDESGELVVQTSFFDRDNADSTLDQGENCDVGHSEPRKENTPENVREQLKERINYAWYEDIFSDSFGSERSKAKSLERVDCVINILTEAIVKAQENGFIQLSQKGRTVTRDEIEERFLHKLEKHHIEYFFEKLDLSKVSNIRSYTLTAMYNSIEDTEMFTEKKTGSFDVDLWYEYVRKSDPSKDGWDD